MSREESGELLDRFSNGDAGALDRLIALHLPALRAFVRVRCGPRLRAKESAGDLVQSVCRELLEDAGKFRHQGEGAFKAWLFAAAARKVADRADYWQAAKRDPEREVPIAHDRSTARGGDLELLAIWKRSCSPSQALMAREAIAAIETALDELPDDYREAILLSRVVGLSRAEVATAMGKTEDSVRHLLFRGLARLSEKLDGVES